MNNLKYARKSLTPINSLKKQLSWLPDKTESFQKTRNSSLKIALIAGERLHASLQYEGEILTLTETNWQWCLKYGQPDLLLIESCSQSATGDWFMAQTEPELEDSALGRLVQHAHQAGLPVAYWFTLDVQYLSAYEQMIRMADKAYCADDRAVQLLKDQKTEASLLLPAVQPAIFTKLTQYSPEKKLNYKLVCDDLVDVVQSWDEKAPLVTDLQEHGAVFFDSMNQIWHTKIQKLSLPGDSILGTIDFVSKAALFKQSRMLGVLRSQSRTRTEIQWSIIEAASSHMPIVLEPGVSAGLLEDLCLTPGTTDQFFVELIKHDKDRLYHERVAQKTWRAALQLHTFSHRIQQICEDLRIQHDWIEYPSAALITPSYRKKFIQRAKNNFAGMNYPNKHWVLVFNGAFEEFEEIKKEVGQGLQTVWAIYVPSELHAGPCMNAGIQKAPTQYVFRMDDDDYYGENYLSDLMLYARVVDFDVIGKSFRYFVMDESYPGAIFSRTSKAIEFDKPSLCLAKDLPKNINFLAGCSQGGRRDFLIINPYPTKNFGSVDSQWLDGLREVNVGKILCVDDYNMVVDRRSSGDHTWSANMDQFVKNSKKIRATMEDVALV